MDPEYININIVKKNEKEGLLIKLNKKKNINLNKNYNL